MSTTLEAVARVGRRFLESWRGDLPDVSQFASVTRGAIAAEAERERLKREIATQRAAIRDLAESVADSGQREADYRSDYMLRAAELIEAKQMCGSGPWLVAEARPLVGDPSVSGQKLREASPITSQGAYGDIALALQNVEWRREVNLSWLEFSRWGIQQIILVSRLYYIKNPIIRRLIDVASCYVFGRGVEVSSPDADANDVLKDFFERNRKTLGQIALTELERSKYTDGNIFFAFFPDLEDKGQLEIRTIDPTEIMDIVRNPEDADTPWYYRRSWTQQNFDVTTGAINTAQMDAWYPALGYDPAEKPAKIGAYPVMWDCPVHHRRCGHVAKWTFGCPIIFPALDWAREARRFLEACASVMAALNQIAIKITSKGGQQALAGIKQQLGTTVSVSSQLYDINPPAVAGATFASGPGTTLDAMKTSGAAQDPERVRQYKLMCAMVVGVPETFMGDVSTGNLATATTLDRPTELVFLERQEAWREDLVVIARYVLAVSARAANGALREALNFRRINPEGLVFREAARVQQPDGSWVYEAKSKRIGSKPAAIEVKCTFPSIREGDIPQLVDATVKAMTLGNTQGQVVGIDEKTGVERLYELLGVEDGNEIAEDQYPESDYDPDRTQEEPPPAPAPAVPMGPPTQGLAGVPAGPAVVPKADSKSMKEAISRLLAAVHLREGGKPNGEAKI
jgi:hypothetical protein